MTKNLNHVAGFPIRKSFPFPLLRMEISEIRSTLTISFYPHILKLKGAYELINYLNIPKHFMVFLGWNWRKQRNINRIKWNMMPWLELLTRIKIEKLLKESHCWIPDQIGHLTRQSADPWDDLWPGWVNKNLFPLVTLKRPNRRGSRSNGCITKRESSSR